MRVLIASVVTDPDIVPTVQNVKTNSMLFARVKPRITGIEKPVLQVDHFVFIFFEFGRQGGFAIG